MKLVNMKITPSENKDCSMLCSDEGTHRYPYGLCLSLEDEVLKKLGFTDTLPPGTIIKIEASAIIENASENLSLKGERLYANAQITDLGVEAVGTAKNAASRLYGKAKS